MKKIKVILGTAVLVSLLGFSSFAAITTTPKGVQKLDSADIVDALNNNADVLDNHIDKIATSDILGHVKIGSGFEVTEDGTANVKIANDFNTDDSETALSAAMGKELKDSLVPDSLQGWIYSDLQNNTTKDVNWNDYEMLLFTTGDYNNVFQSIMVPSSYFKYTSDDFRVILTWDKSIIQVYKDTNTSVNVVCSDLKNEQRLQVYGFIKK